MSESGYRRPCARTLDRPIVVFGLEPEDLVVVGLVSIGLLFVADGFVGVGAGLGLWVALVRLKAGKPPGYLVELAHRVGILDRLPASWRPPQVLPRREAELSPFAGEEDDELARSWWSARPRPPFPDSGGGGGGEEGTDPDRAAGGLGAGLRGLPGRLARLARRAIARRPSSGGAA